MSNELEIVSGPNTLDVVDAFETLEATPKGRARLEKLGELLEKSLALREVLYRVLSPDITFGVKKVPEPEGAGVFAQGGFEDNLIDLLDKLASRELSGNAASEAIANFLSACNDLEQKWTERIIKRDLRLSISAKSVNKVYPGLIPTFPHPGAIDVNKATEKDLNGSWAIQPKMDGARCVAVIPPEGEIQLLSRTGKQWKNFDPIVKQLEDWREKHGKGLPSPLYLDGEVVVIENGKIKFQAIQKVMLASESKTQVGELRYIVWDAALEGEWNEPQIPYKDRFRFLQSLKLEDCGVQVIDSLWYDDVQFTHEALMAACKASVEAGYEGVMVRRSDKPVQMRKCKDILKVKLFKDSEAQVIGFVEGEGRLKGTLGALVCKTVEGGVEFQIGTGFDDKDREEIWNNQDTYLNKYVNYKLVEFTDDGVPRQPVFRSFRHEDDFD